MIGIWKSGLEQQVGNIKMSVLEFSVRDLAVEHDRDLEVWTGATGG